MYTDRGGGALPYAILIFNFLLSYICRSADSCWVCCTVVCSSLAVLAEDLRVARGWIFDL